MTIEQYEIEAFLRTLPRVSNWPERDIRWLASNAVQVELPADTSVFARSTQSDDAFIVYDGQVRQYIEDAKGEEWWFRTCTKGAVLMQERLFRGEGHATQAVTEMRSILLQVHASALNELLTRHPELWDLLSFSTAFRLQGIPILRALNDNQIEILASTVEIKEFKPGQTICTREDEDGRLWIIDWGQVRISERGEVGVDGGGHNVVYEQNGQGSSKSSSQPSILTAGNYFAGGQLAIWDLRGLETVTAVAETRVKLLSIDRGVVERMIIGVADVRNQLSQHFDLGERLVGALSKDELFADLQPQHWDDLLSITGWEHVPADLDVVRQGQDGTKLYILAAGTAHVFARDASGRELPQYLLNENDRNFFGVHALLSHDRYVATVRSTQSPLADGTTLDGSDWLTLQEDDLKYLINSKRERWERTKLGATVLKGPVGKEYDWLKQDEDVMLVTRRHSIWLWLRVILAFVIAYGFVGLLALIDAIFKVNITTLAYALALLVPLVLLLTWYMVDYYNDYYVVTTQRLVRRDQVLLISENRVDAMMERVQDTELRTRLIGKIFNFGDLNISTAATGGVIRFTMLPNPAKVQGIIAGLQAQRKAFVQAEERENLRHMMLQKLSIRLIPTYPPRVLPEGTMTTAQVGPVAAFFRRLLDPFERFFHWLWRFPETAYIWLISLISKSAGEEVKKERAAKKKRKAEKEPDTVVYRKHPWFLVRAAAIPIITLILTGIVILIPGKFIQSLGLPTLIEGGLAIWVVICLFWLWFRVENWRNDKYILTRSHIIDIYALPLGLRESVKQAEWDKVQNASFLIPYFWANLLDFGTVTVETASTFGNFEFLHVPHPEAVQQEVFLRLEIARHASEQKAKAAQQSVQLEALDLYHHYQTDPMYSGADT
ncbi:MAG: cyclic nucleotide-binding domain-containing protein [Anaerolineae bacterium]|nr:cyclic nucleotide-binding domain-containing protein [Anaerolineae bacterium]